MTENFSLDESIDCIVDLEVHLEEDRSFKKVVWGMILFFLQATIGWVFQDYFYGKEMMRQSIELTIYQQTYNSDFFKGWNYFWYELSIYSYSYWPFVAQVLYPNKLLGLKTFSIIQFTMWLKNSLKLVYLDERPNLLSKDILGLECKCEFGKPSGTLMNTSTIFMLIAWDTCARDAHKKVYKRLLIMLLSILAISVVSLSILSQGIHSYNQLIFAFLLSQLIFWVFTLYEEQMLDYWKVIITHQPIWLFKSYMINSVLAVFALLSIYVALVASRWHSKDFTVYKNTHCSKCSEINWCWETIFQNTSLVAFPAVLFALSLRSHCIEYNANYFRRLVTSWRGFVRILISFIFWSPIIFWYYPSFESNALKIMSSTIKNVLASLQLFYFGPFIFRKLSQEFKGDIAEKAKLENLFENKTELHEFDSNKKLGAYVNNKDNLPSVLKSKNSHPRDE